MRIGIYFNAPFGGAFYLLKNHVEQLAKNHEIYLYSVTIDKSIPDFYGLRYNPSLIPSLAPYVREERHLSDPRSGNNWYKVIQRLGRGKDRLKTLIKRRDLDFILRSAAEMGRAFEEDACDVIIGHIDAFTRVPLPLGKTSLPTVFFCVEPNRSLYDGGKLSELIEGHMDSFSRRLVRLDRGLASSVTQFACNSLYTRESIYHAYGKIAWVIPSGVDVEVFRRDSRIAKENLVLSVGVLMQHKAPTFLLESVARIEERKRPRVAFVYPRGSEGLRESLTKLAAAKRVDVEFHPKIGLDDLVALYNRARVCAYPAIMEPGGLVPLESQACGTPVVAVNEGGNREEVRDGVTGFLTERDPRDFAAAIERLLIDDRLILRMGAAGAEWMHSERTWDKIVLGMEKRLQHLVSNGSGIGAK